MTRRRFRGYIVYDDGRVWSPRTHRFLRPYACKRDGYLSYVLYDGHGNSVRYTAHFLMLHCFVGKRPQGKVARHLDGNPANNRLSNLKWGTQKQNWDDKRKHGRATIGERHGRAKLKTADVLVIRKFQKYQGYRQELAKRYSVSAALIDDIRNRKSWRHV